MEEVYPREDHTGVPELYLRTVGKGRVAYIPWDVGRAFWTFLTVDHGKLLANLVRWARGADEAVTVTGQGVIDVAVWEQEQSMTVHLVKPHQSHDDERPFPRTHPEPGATSHYPAPRPSVGRQGAVAQARPRTRVRPDRRAVNGERPIG